MPNVHLLFVGSGDLGPQLRSACHVVFDADSPLRLERGEGQGEVSTPRSPSSKDALPVASFLGFRNQSELPACYVAADVLVLPSESETWGLAVNEAMACGLPAIVSDAVGCAPDLIEERKTGLTFPVGDHPALADRLAQMVSLKQNGHDLTPVLAEKLKTYSVEAAVEGTIKAVEKLQAQTAKLQ